MNKLNQTIRELRLRLQTLNLEYRYAIGQGNFLKSRDITEKIIWINEEISNTIQQIKLQLKMHS